MSAQAETREVINPVNPVTRETLTVGRALLPAHKETFLLKGGKDELVVESFADFSLEGLSQDEVIPPPITLQAISEPCTVKDHAGRFILSDPWILEPRRPMSLKEGEDL
jgi:hypothetical protein